MKKRAILQVLTAFLTLCAVGDVEAANTSGVPVPAKPAFEATDAGKHGTEIANYLEKFDSGWTDAYQRALLKTSDSSGKNAVTQETYQMIRERDSGNHSLIRFMAPADVRGVGTLLHEKIGSTDDTWLFLPANRRTRRVAGANRQGSFQGTEFTFEDLSTFEVARYDWKFVEHTSVKIAGKTQSVYRLEARPKYSNSGYSRLVVDINDTHWRLERTEYYDRADRLLKVLERSRWQELHGRYWRPKHLEMVNAQTGKRTEVSFEDIRLNLALYPKGSALTEDQLSRSALENP